MAKDKISVVCPVYSCECYLVELYQRLSHTFSSLDADFELILVNDASPDNAWDTIIKLSKNDTRVKGINFSRNFGQHYAITAGLEYCSGGWIVVMDCDLQDRPEKIPNLLVKVNEGFMIVFAKRIERKHSRYKRWFSTGFYHVLGYLTGTQQDATIANFGIYHKKVIQSLLSMQDYHRFFPTMVRWVGFTNLSFA